MVRFDRQSWWIEQASIEVGFLPPLKSTHVRYEHRMSSCHHRLVGRLYNDVAVDWYRLDKRVLWLISAEVRTGKPYRPSGAAYSLLKVRTSSWPVKEDAGSEIRYGGNTCT